MTLSPGAESFAPGGVEESAEGRQQRGEASGNEEGTPDSSGRKWSTAKRRQVLIAVVIALLVVGGAGIFATVTTSGGKGGPALVDRTGAPAQEFSLPSLLTPSQQVSLSAFRGHGLVLNFWASWCYPCTKEMPLLEAAYRSDRGKVQFLGIDSGDSSGAAISFLAKVHVTYPSVFDSQEKLASAYGLFGLPTTVFISADGKVLGRHIGQLDSKTLHEALAEAFGGHGAA